MIDSYESRLDLNKYFIMEPDEEKCDKIVDEIDALLDKINIYNSLKECEIPTTEDGEINYYSSYFFG